MHQYAVYSISPAGRERRVSDWLPSVKRAFDALEAQRRKTTIVGVLTNGHFVKDTNGRVIS